MNKCSHYYIENGPRIAVIPKVQATPDDKACSSNPKTIWTIEKICTSCNKIAIFNQDGYELPNVEVSGRPHLDTIKDN